MRKSSRYIHSQRGMEIDDAVLTMTERGAARVEWPVNRHFLTGYLVVGLVVLAVLFGKSAYMSVIEGEKYRTQAVKNSVREWAVAAPRGMIYDVYGKPLVRNMPSVDVVFVPFDGPHETVQKQQFVERLRDKLGVAEDVATKVLEVSGTRMLSPLLLKESVDQDMVADILSHEADFPGIGFEKSVKREYIDGRLFSHVLGYEGRVSEDELTAKADQGYFPTDMIGKQGIEKSYEDILRGQHGYERIEVDAFGRPSKTLGLVSPTAGSDLYLNIDADLQKQASDILQTSLEQHHLSRGAVIAMNPEDGAIRALVSYPGYDNNLFAEGISTEAYRALALDPDKPLFNRAISGVYAPGSTFKPMMASAALNEGVIDPATRIESRGGISIGNFFFGDWKAHGFTDLRQAIAVSSDVYFYTIGGGYGGITGLGIDRIKRYANLFGYGDVTGIDVPGEATGMIPDKQWKEDRFHERWYIGDDYHASIGQGYVTATPLQILNSIAAIANGGTLYAPRVVSYTRGADGKVVANPPHVIRSSIVPDTVLQVVREGMRQTVTSGTAQSLKTLPVAVAGKTGTAQFGTGDLTHGWFVSFAPFEKPSLAMIVLVESQEGESYNAVPISQAIYQWYFSRNSDENKGL